MPTTSSSPWIVSFFGFMPSSPSDGCAPLHISSCRLFAFSCTVSDPSDSIARIAVIRSSEPLDPPVPSPTTGFAAITEQSGQSHWRASARVLGREEERQATCQGVAHVLQARLSSGDRGFFLHAMQMPSPSQGSSLACAMGVNDKPRGWRWLERAEDEVVREWEGKRIWVLLWALILKFQYFPSTTFDAINGKKILAFRVHAEHVKQIAGSSLEGYNEDYKVQSLNWGSFIWLVEYGFIW